MSCVSCRMWNDATACGPLLLERTENHENASLPFKLICTYCTSRVLNCLNTQYQLCCLHWNRALSIASVSLTQDNKSPGNSKKQTKQQALQSFRDAVASGTLHQVGAPWTIYFHNQHTVTNLETLIPSSVMLQVMLDHVLWQCSKLLCDWCLSKDESNIHTVTYITFVL